MSPKILLLSASILCFAGLQSLSAASAGPEIISEPLPAPKAAAPQTLAPQTLAPEIIIAPQIAQSAYILAKADADSDSAAVKKAVKKKAKAKTKKSKAAADSAAAEKEPKKSRARSHKAKTAQSQAAAPAYGSAGPVQSGAKTYTHAAGNNNCSCASATYCIGPRNGHYCYSASGKKRYLKHNK